MLSGLFWGESVKNGVLGLGFNWDIGFKNQGYFTMFQNYLEFRVIA